MTGKAVRESLAALGVVASLIFVGLEVRASTAQARAAAYQEIGLATAGLHLGLDEWDVRLSIEQNDAQSVSEWSPLDWQRTFRGWLGILRIWETLQLQIEQGILPVDALDRLGWNNTPAVAWRSVAFVCVLPAIRQNTSESLMSVIEAGAPLDVPTCPFQEVPLPGW